MRCFIVRADGAWFSRVVKVCEDNRITTGVSAYSDVRLVRMPRMGGGGRDGLYQPLRAGDIIVNGDDVQLSPVNPRAPLSEGRRPAVNHRRQLVTSTTIEPPTPELKAVPS